MESAWPPRSPRAALLSSPSGRLKYQLGQRPISNPTSPVKKSATRPNLRLRSRELPDEDSDRGKDDPDEDDEETLQLKLAAIKAKLKLKKLQRSKVKSHLVDSDVEKSGLRPLSVVGSSLVSNRSGELLKRRLLESTNGPTQEDVEVPLSPIKKSISIEKQRSPGRVLLGIDKGIKAGDISLRRAQNTQDHASKRGGLETHRSATRSSAYSSVRMLASSTTSGTRHVKSFSERLTDSRLQDRNKENRRDATERTRSAGFKLNHAEVDSLRLAAQEARAHDRPRSPVRHSVAVNSSTMDTLCSRNERKSSSGLVKQNSVSILGASSARNVVRASNEDSCDSPQQSQHQGYPSNYEPFSQLHLSSRILPHSFLQRTLPSETHSPFRIPHLLQKVHAPTYELPESVIDYVVFGIIASKSSPHDHRFDSGSSNSAASARGSSDWEKQWDDGSQNQKKFMVMQLTDLTWSIDLYLFATALPRYHRLSLGTVVAILNPGIMPPKKGKEDTGAFSLTLHSGDDTVLEIGTARDLGFCKAVKGDGKECGSWVNAAKTEHCEWHLNAQVSRTQAGRMGVNTGSNRFGLGSQRPKNHFNSRRERSVEQSTGGRQGLVRSREGQHFDRNTGSQYFISSSVGIRGSRGPVYQSDRSAANLLDMDTDDPFIAEGQLSRDRESRLRKRLVAEEKERDIARKLGSIGSGGAGGEYIRQKLGEGITSTNERGSEGSALTTRASILSSGATANGNGKRTAEHVRLSPIKKTRFLTENGIREAGRESLGTKQVPGRGKGDDDLDIV